MPLKNLGYKVTIVAPVLMLLLQTSLLKFTDLVVVGIS